MSIEAQEAIKKLCEWPSWSDGPIQQLGRTVRDYVEAPTKERDFALGRMNNQFNLRNELRIQFDKLTIEKDQAVAACEVLSNGLNKALSLANVPERDQDDKWYDDIANLNKLLEPTQGQPLLDLLHEARALLNASTVRNLTVGGSPAWAKERDKWNEAAKEVGIQ